MLNPLGLNIGVSEMHVEPIGLNKGVGEMYMEPIGAQDRRQCNVCWAHSGSL